MDIYHDDRVVLTLDAGGTNFVFNAFKSGKETKTTKPCKNSISCCIPYVDNRTAECVIHSIR